MTSTHTPCCRFCENLVDVSAPRAKYIGRCKYRKRPEDCDSFELALCYDGHDPRNEGGTL